MGSNLPRSLASTPKLVYLNLPLPVGGRGGTLRFFMLAHGIKFEEDLTEMKDWPAKKKELISSGINPAATVPILEVGDQILTQHVSIMRYLAHETGISSGSTYSDYVQDLVSDEYQTWRDAWVAAAFGPEEGKSKYKSETIPAKLKMFEALYSKYKTKDVFLSESPAGIGLWGDTAVFTIIFDNINTEFLSKEQLGEYPCLNSLYEKYGALPQVSTWVEENIHNSK